MGDNRCDLFIDDTPPKRQEHNDDVLIDCEKFPVQTLEEAAHME